MRREQILSVLCDLSLAIGAEVRVAPLLRAALQRLLHHTGFPVGMVLSGKRIGADQASAVVDMAIGDHRLIALKGMRTAFPAEVIDGPVELFEAPSLADALPDGSRPLTHCLRLPVDEDCAILLLSPTPPASTLPLTQIFQPVLNQLSRALQLCRTSEAHTQRLQADRDQAREAMAQTLRDTATERAFLHSLLRSIPDMVWLKDVDGAFLACNPAFERLYGATEAQILGKTDYDFVPKSLADFFRQKDQEAMVADAPRTNEEWVTYAADGQDALIETTKNPMRDESGLIIGVLGISRDITHIRDTQEELAARAEIHHAIIEQAPDAIALISDDGGFTEFNTAAHDMLGYSRDDFSRMNIADIEANTDTAYAAAIMQRIKQTGESVFDTRHRHRDGHILEVRVRARALTLDGKPYFAAVWSDITENQRVARELEAHRQHLEALVSERTGQIDALNRELARRAREAEMANSAKSTFLANMSHEIRTPMNAIVGITHLMRRDNHDPTQLARLDRVGDAAHHLLDIINDILDFSKIEANKLVLEQVDFDLAALLQRACTMVSERASAKGLALGIDPLPAGLQKRQFVGDPTRLSQMLLNYLSNAIKFTENGRIDVSANLVQAGTDASVVRITVRDTGIGLDQVSQERLFNAFEQADSSTTRRFGGTGLGLAINKRLARLMGGSVGVDSREGEGSAFWMTLHLPHSKAGLAAPAADDATVPQSLAGKRVLLAEDNPINQEVAVELLSDIGLEVVVADDGAQAVQRFQSEAFDLILMDMQMPRMDGLEACRRIRALPRGADIPILAMTANAFAEDRERCMAAGMNAHLSKPVEPDILYEAMDRWLKPVASVGTAPVTSASAPPPTTDIVLDAPTGLRNHDGKAARWEHQLRRFLRNHGDDLIMMARHRISGDLNTAAQMAQLIASSADALGAGQLGHRAGALSEALEQADADRIDACFAQLREAWTALREQVQHLRSDTTRDTGESADELLGTLSRMLADDDFCATGFLTEHHSAVVDALGPEASSIERHVNDYDYPGALALLKQAMADARAASAEEK